MESYTKASSKFLNIEQLTDYATFELALDKNIKTLEDNNAVTIAKIAKNKSKYLKS